MKELFLDLVNKFIEEFDDLSESIIFYFITNHCDLYNFNEASLSCNDFFIKPIESSSTKGLYGYIENTVETLTIFNSYHTAFPYFGKKGCVLYLFPVESSNSLSDIVFDKVVEINRMDPIDTNCFCVYRDSYGILKKLNGSKYHESRHLETTYDILNMLKYDLSYVLGELEKAEGPWLFAIIENVEPKNILMAAF